MNPQIKNGQNRPIIRLKTLSKVTSGPCDVYSTLANAAMRANGIPVGFDFTPQWPFRSLGHSWNFLHENTKKNVPFEGAGWTVGRPHGIDHIISKVYRNKYKINKEIIELIKEQKQMVPMLFSTPYIEDVTDEYLSTIDVQIKVNAYDPYVYLSVFDNKNWRILAFGRNEGGTALFTKVGKDGVFLPVRYSNQGIEPIGNPFIIYLNGKIKEIVPDTSKKQTLKLFRKYPMFEHVYVSNLRKIGTKIQGANKRDFSDSVTFHVFDDFETDISINEDNEKFRYWRALSADNGHSNIAELLFYSNGLDTPMAGEIIGTDGSFMPGEMYKKEAVFDGDLLTFFDAPYGSGCWVGMDFKNPVAVNRVTSIMRGDGNDIEIGNEYELKFWNNGKWKSLGKKVATDIFLKYDNCPEGALFLLHNKTKGGEERIFTYENGKQIWW